MNPARRSGWRWLRSRALVTPRRIIVVVTAASLLAAFVINAIWFARSTGTGRLEPIVGVLGILAGITGLIAERWAAAQEARQAALNAIRAELEANRDLLTSAAFGEGPNQPLRRTVYPRLYLSAVDAAFAGGALSTTRDAKLITALHGWRNQVVRFNSQLALAEMLAFTVESESVLRDLREGLHGTDGPLARMRTSIEGLVDRLATTHH
jgi:hypothetical protein